MSTTQTKERTKASNGAQSPTFLPPTVLSKEIEYVPLGAAMAIKLTVAGIRMILNPKTRSGRPAPDQDILKFMMLCKARQLDPFEGDAYLIGYEGQDGDEWSLITSIYAFLKRAEVSPNFDGKESGVIVRTADGKIEEHIGDFLMDDETLLGGWCKVYRKDRKYPEVRRVEFKRYSTGKSRWQKDPAGQICKVAECQCLRDTFPTTLGGLFVHEEFDAVQAQFEKQQTASLPMTRERVLPAKPIDVQTEQQAEPPTDEHGEIAQEPAADRVTQETLDTIQEQATHRGQTNHAVRTEAEKRFGVQALGELTEQQGLAMVDWLLKLPVARQPGEDG